MFSRRHGVLAGVSLVSGVVLAIAWQGPAGLLMLSLGITVGGVSRKKYTRYSEGKETHMRRIRGVEWGGR